MLIEVENTDNGGWKNNLMEVKNTRGWKYRFICSCCHFRTLRNWLPLWENAIKWYFVQLKQWNHCWKYKYRNDIDELSYFWVEYILGNMWMGKGTSMESKFSSSALQTAIQFRIKFIMVEKEVMSVMVLYHKILC